ncbi:hypothetical protein FRB99_008696 [Tulasnella sp. 403]|nr:hypothetical protein FRB99_008696 [Tulasnella sp. 403]
MPNLSAERSSSKSPHNLAPLEYLQLNQRRGSITDPSLHHHHQPDQSPPRHYSSTHRAASFSFPNKPTDNGHSISDHPQRPWSTQPMDTDPVNSPTGRNSAGPDAPRSNSGSYLPPPSFTGSKRKMSHDRQGYHYPDDPTSHPGGYSSYSTDMDAPQAKRRGSTYDTRISHLTLQDRRDSVDSRSSLSGISMGGGWAGDRRDSAASVYSTTSLGSSVGGYSTASPGEPHGSHAGKPYWTSPSAQHQQPPQDASADQHNPPRPFAFPQDPVGSGQQSSQYSLSSVPPIPSTHYSASAAAARRLSIPESSLPLNGIKSRTRGGSRSSRGLTSTSEESLRPPADPPSANSSPMAQHSMGPPSTTTTSDNGAAMTSPSYVQNLQQPQPPPRKETPYSRSPELRISHKMAERKRRKEMKDLFDELRDQLPADRGMKASKWEILSKAVDYISQLKVAYTDMSSEIERLRGELDALRPAGSSAPSAPPVTYHLVPPPQGAPSIASAPGPAPGTSSPTATRNGNHAPPTSNGAPASYNDRPSSAHSSHHSSLPDARSPSVPTHPLQQQHSGSQQSPYASTHQTPTPQQQPQPLPSTGSQ